MDRLAHIRQIYARARQSIADTLKRPVTTITSDADFHTEFETDSLGMIEIAMALEKEFGIRIDDESALKIKTLEDVVNYISKHTSP